MLDDTGKQVNSGTEAGGPDTKEVEALSGSTEEDKDNSKSQLRLIEDDVPRLARRGRRRRARQG